LLNWDILKYTIEQAEIKSFYLKKNISLALVTNLTLMDEEKLAYLMDHNVYISTSLDGDEVLHNENRTFREGNSFESVSYWIKRVNEEYKKRNIMRKVGALLTVTKKSLLKYREIIDTYIEL